jgi:hypothetical protein
MEDQAKVVTRLRMRSGIMDRRGFLLGSGAVFGLAACTAAPPPADLPKLTFEQLQPIRFDVARLDVRNNYQPTFFPPHVEHQMRQPPYDVLQVWARRRIQPTGSSGEALMVIHNASIVERQIQAAKSFGPISVQQPRYEYVANFAVRMDAVSPYWDLRGFAEGQAEGRLTLDDTSKLDTRERLLIDLVEQTITDMDRAFVNQLQANLSALIAR